MIENLPFEQCFVKYISRWKYDDSVVYADPPYVLSTRKGKYYKHEMSDEQHEQFINLVLKHSNNAKYIISGYDNDIYKTLERNGFNKYTFKTKISACRGMDALCKQQDQFRKNRMFMV